MIELALDKFKTALSLIKVGEENLYNEKQIKFLVELARKQLGDHFLGKLRLVSLDSREKFAPESKDGFLKQRLDKVLDKIELKHDKIPVPFDANDNHVWREAFEIDDVDYLRWDYKEGVVYYRYTLSKKHLLSLIRCFLSDGSLNLSDKRHPLRPLKNLVKFNNPNGTLQSIPELPKKVINKLDVGYVNYIELTKDVSELGVDSLANENYKTIIHFFQGVNLINKLHRQRLTPTKKSSIFSYPLAYYITGSNHPRLTDRVGVQQSRNELLTAMYKDVTFCNQDIVSSGVNMLEKLMKDAGIDTAWLVSYLKDPEKYRQDLMTKVGVDRSAIKAALQAVTNGGVFSTSSSGAVYKALEAKDDPDLSYKRASEFLDGVKELEKPMKELGKTLMDLEKCKTLGWCFRGKLKNAIGQYYDALAEEKKSKDKRTAVKQRKELAKKEIDTGGVNGTRKKYLERLISARLPPLQGRKGQRFSFMVMGMEQSFILRLIELLPADNPVYVLKHDGFISKLLVPEELIEKVKAECDLPHLKFIEEEM